MANVLVVGGAGYIGAHMCLRLREAGHAITVLDNLVTGHRAAVQWGGFVQGEAAEPYAYYRNNVAATPSLLETMRAQGVDRFIFSSTAAVYGEPQSERIAEDHPRQPINPYGRTKLAVEHLLEDAASAYGLRAVALRYFKSAGADPMGGIGESHQPETHLIPRLLRKAAGEALDVRMFGTDYATRDGSCIRDYVHVGDLAEAHLRALEFARVQPGFQAFNLGNGDGYSVIEVVRAAEAVVGRSLDIPCGPRRAGDPAMPVASSAKAREVLGWRPRYPEIGRIVADAWRWHRQPAY